MPRINFTEEDKEFIEKRRKKYGKARLSEKGFTIDYNINDIMDHLPNLARELLNPPKNAVLPISGYQNEIEDTDDTHDTDVDELNNVDSYKEYQEKLKRIKEITTSQYAEDSELFMPKTEDFIRRSNTLEEALEIIDFQLKMGKITKEKADELKKICKEKGIRYFGNKKEWGYYERRYRFRRDNF